jgi:LTXXQ motif family protein
MFSDFDSYQRNCPSLVSDQCKVFGSPYPCEGIQQEVCKMKYFNSSGFIRATAIACLLTIATPAFADDDRVWFWGKGMMGHWFKGEMMDRGMMEGWGAGMMMGSRFNEERLNALKTELAITDTQKKVWDDYVAAVKTAVDSMRASHGQMMKADIPATLPERIALHESMMATRLGVMKSTDAATLALYQTLDAAQKRKADDLIMGMGMM